MSTAEMRNFGIELLVASCTPKFTESGVTLCAYNLY